VALYLVKYVNVFWLVCYQVLEFTGCCVTLSAPNSTIIVTTKYRKEGDTPEVRQLMRDVIRWECRPYPSMQPQPIAYVLKFKVFSAVALPLFKYVTILQNVEYLLQIAVNAIKPLTFAVA
jgi:hypothetical protein